MRYSAHRMSAYIPWLLCTVAMGMAPANAGQLKWQLPQLAKQLAEKPQEPSSNNSAKAAAANGAGSKVNGTIVKNGWILARKLKPIVDAAGQERVAPSQRPFHKLFGGATAVVTGFSGSHYRKLLLPRGKPNPAAKRDDTVFIDLDGVSASLTGIDDFGFAMNGNEIDRRPYDQLLARDIGQVFGVAIDDQDKPNLYLAATSVYGLPIVGPDKNADGLPDRLRKGAKDASWMAGLFGAKPGVGPGTIWRVDGVTGQVMPFTSIMLDGVANSGPGLGNIAYDAANRQLFVSDLDTGMIHRLDLDGNDLDHFDHGVAVRPKAALDAVAFDKNDRLDITSVDFDAQDPSSWHYAKAERRVWGLDVHQGRLFYAVAEGPQIWSVGLDEKSGEFLDDARWELSIEDKHGEFEISDIAFASNGTMILAQRGNGIGSYDFTTLAETGTARVLRYVLEDPDDKETGSRWAEKDARRHPVGFAGSNDNTSGGLALGPGYDEEGRLDWRQCGSSLWTSGENLRKSVRFEPQLAKGGMMSVDGLQVQPLGLPAELNSPPWISYFLDYDGKASNPTKSYSGHIGDVEVLGCHGTVSKAFGDPSLFGGDFFDPGMPYQDGASEWADLPDYGPFYPGAPGDGDDGSDDFGGEWWPCLINPALCEVPQPKSCLKTKTELVCDKETGNYVVKVTATDDLSNGFDMIDISNPGGLLSKAPDQAITFPGSVELSASGMSAGQIGQLNFCAFNADAKQSGNPYDCCKSSATFQIPAIECKKEGE